MKKLFKITTLALMFTSTFANAGLEINIKASEISKKTLVIGQIYEEKLKNEIYNNLSIFNNINIESSKERCENVYKKLDTSYYCIDVSLNKNGLIEGSLKEKFGSKSHKEVNFYQNQENIEINKKGRDLASSIYKYIFNKETFLNSKLAYVQRKDLRDGNKIFNLKISDFNGENSKTLLASPQPILSIDWSPNNKKIAYVSYEKVRSSIFIHDLELGSRIRVATFKGINAFPSWSPSGKEMAFSLSKDGSSDIYIFDVSKKHLKKITSFKYEAAEPVWISEKEIAFTSDKGGVPSIFKLDLKTKNISKMSKDFSYATSAKASNDLNKLYAIYSKGGNAGIFEIDKKTKKERVLVNDFFAESPSVAKGDETIIYSTKKNGKSILRAVDLKGVLLYEIESTGADLKEPSYSN